MKQPPRDLPGASAGPIIIETAVITAAVLPFVQEVAKRTADDSYDAAKKLVRRMIARYRPSGAPPDIEEQGLGKPRGILINDETLRVQILLDDDLPPQAIRELRELDLDTIPGSIIQWAWIGHRWAWTYQRIDETGALRSRFSKQGLIISGSQGAWNNGKWVEAFIDTSARTYKIS